MKKIFKLLVLVGVLTFAFTSCDEDKIVADTLDYPQESFIAFERADEVVTLENDATPIELVVNYSNSLEAATSDVTVGFTVTSDTAVEGVDYMINNASNQLNFPAGVFSQIISITPIDNNLSDGDKVLNITLTTSNGAPIGYPGTDVNNSIKILTISDDDCPFLLTDFDQITWSGSDNAPASQGGPDDTQITTTFDGTNLYMSGIAYGWLTNPAYWDEVVVNDAPVLVDISTTTGIFTIAEQFLCTTTYNGATQPDYSISATGQYFSCTKTMVVNYTLYQGGGVLRQFTETITF